MHREAVQQETFEASQHGSVFVDFTATVSRTADATLVVGMQCCFIVDRDLFAGLYVSQGEEQDVIANDLHEGVRNARVVDVMRAIPAAAAVKAPPTVDFADAQHLSMRSPARFGVGDLLPSVLRNLVAFFKTDGGEAAFTVYRRRLDS